MSVTEFEVRIAKLQKKILDDLQQEVPDEVEKLAATDIPTSGAGYGYGVVDLSSPSDASGDVKASAEPVQDVTAGVEQVKSSAAETKEILNDLRSQVVADIEATKKRLQEGVNYFDQEASRRDQTRRAERDDL